jgi:hypothetical protein
MLLEYFLNSSSTWKNGLYNQKWHIEWEMLGEKHWAVVGIGVKEARTVKSVRTMPGLP